MVDLVRRALPFIAVLSVTSAQADAMPSNVQRQCVVERDEDGWLARLYLTNRGGAPVTVQVTAVVRSGSEVWRSGPWEVTLEPGRQARNVYRPFEADEVIEDCTAEEYSPSSAGDKSPANAFLLSFGVTASSVPLLLFALDQDESGGQLSGPLYAASALAAAFGPSVGHWYAHDGLNRGQLFRLGGAAATVLAVAIDPPCLLDCRRDTSNIGTIVAIAGVGVYTYGMLYEIFTAPSAAREYNQRRALTIAPTPLAAIDGAAPGVILSGRF